MSAFYWFLKTKTRAALAMALLFAILVSSGALASAGLLDTTFGTNGKVTTSLGPGDDTANAVALQPDGKIVAVGQSDNGLDDDFALARYTSSGFLDTTFSNDGKLTTGFPSNESGRAVALQPDGKIIVAGTTSSSVAGNNSNFALLRINSDGSADTTFNGIVTTDFGGGDDGANAVALQPDGKIVVVGESIQNGSFDFAVARYNSDGSADTTFSTDGKLTTGFPSDEFGRAVALQPDGKIIVAGESNFAGNADFALLRINSDGSADITFNGIVTTDFGSGSDNGDAVALQPDGKIIVVGQSNNGLDDDFALARYTSSGFLDTTFSNDGKLTTGFPSNESGNAVALQPDGKIIVAGESNFAGNYDFALLRINNDGSADTTFSGIVITNFGQREFGHAVALQPDGKIIVAGESNFAGNYDFALARYNGDAVFADVPTDYWAWNWIESLYAAGITGGCGVNPLLYCPEASVTRAQMAVFLERGIHGSSYTPPVVGGSTGFGDVSPGYWAAAWIKQLAADGITGGCGVGNYCPELAVTRAQMAVFLLRAKHGASYSPPVVGGSTGFGDVSPGYWAAAWIKQLSAEGITGGCGTGAYCPESPVTRAQMAVFLVRTFNLP